MIRLYQAHDGSRVISLWNACLPADAVDGENFYRRVICDINFDSSLFLLAEKDGELTGFAYGAKRKVPDEIAGLQPDNAWLVAMGVQPRHRGKGLGGALLSALESALADKGAKTIDAGPYPCNYFSPGIDKAAYTTGLRFLQSRGYADKGECCSMDINLRGYETPARYIDKKQKLISGGYEFGAYKNEDALPLFDFIKAHFPWWLNDVRGAILAGRGPRTLILARRENSVAGFVMRAFDGTEERFGPFGVDPALQGVGLGGVLFHEMMNQLVGQRIFYTWFLWTGGRNLDIYGTWGMKAFRTYTMLGKKLD
jgi:GNAT superfamily N-acetyltransferase